MPPKAKPRIALHCVQCGEVFKVGEYEARRGRRFCSKSCAMTNRRRLGLIKPPRGDEHYAWQGDEAQPSVKRERARTRYAINTCERCGSAGYDRHHIDGDTGNNEPENVAILCRRCHMDIDGRMSKFKNVARLNAKRASSKPVKPCIECGTTEGRRDRWYGRCHTCNERARRPWFKALAKARCALCGAEKSIEGHHIIPKARLRDEGVLLPMWDVRNLLPLCSGCHSDITYGVRHLRYDEMPLVIRSFAREFGFEFRGPERGWVKVITDDGGIAA